MWSLLNWWNGGSETVGDIRYPLLPSTSGDNTVDDGCISVHSDHDEMMDIDPSPPSPPLLETPPPPPPLPYRSYHNEAHLRFLNMVHFDQLITECPTFSRVLPPRSIWTTLHCLLRKPDCHLTIDQTRLLYQVLIKFVIEENILRKCWSEQRELVSICDIHTVVVRYMNPINKDLTHCSERDRRYFCNAYNKLFKANKEPYIQVLTWPSDKLGIVDPDPLEGPFSFFKEISWDILSRHVPEFKTYAIPLLWAPRYRCECVHAIDVLQKITQCSTMERRCMLMKMVFRLMFEYHLFTREWAEVSPLDNLVKTVDRKILQFIDELCPLKHQIHRKFFIKAHSVWFGKGRPFYNINK